MPPDDDGADAPLAASAELAGSADLADLPEPDLWLGGRLRLRQPPRGGHRAGTDAVLLVHLLAPEPGAVVCDLGAGTGAVGLAYACRAPDCRVILAEHDPALAALARANLRENGLAGRVAVMEADVLNPAARRRAGLVPGLADLLLTNPPFFEAAGHRASPIAAKATAHAFEPDRGDGLDAWMRACADLLRPGGRLGLIHRADALPGCLAALARRFGAVAVQPVHAQADAPAIRILVSGVKGSRAPFALLPPLVLHAGGGRFTPAVEAMHRGDGLS